MATASLAVIREPRYTVTSIFDEVRIRQLERYQSEMKRTTSKALQDAWDFFIAEWEKCNPEQ
jgi:hypothetical protein